jgi:hypothetical protein
MHHQRWLVLFLAGIGWFLGPATCYAQLRPAELPRRPYVQIPFSEDLDGVLLDQVLKAQGFEGLKTILDKVQKNPAAFKLLQQNAPNLDVTDPKLRAEIEKLLHQQPELLKIDPEKAKAIERALKGAPSESGPAPAPKPTVKPPAAFSKSAPPRPLPQLPVQPLPPLGQRDATDDLLDRWVRDFMKEAERWEWGDLLRDSPALRDGLRELQDLVAKETSSANPLNNEGLGRLAKELQPKGGWDLSLKDLDWSRLRNLSLPSMPSWPRPRFRAPRFGGWGGGPRFDLGLPNLGAPAVGGGFAIGLMWVALIAVAALVLWQMLRQWSARAVQPAPPTWRLGPWPVDPATIASRAELVKAFEYLSLLRLGADARSWNHRAIAANLGQNGGPDEQRQLAADELASLYEQARYAPVADPLPASALASARRHLCFLAGVASA